MLDHFHRDRRLTSREGDIAALAARGCTNAEIATALSVSPKTVEWNLTKVYRVLGVRGRTQLAAAWPRDARPLGGGSR